MIQIKQSSLGKRRLESSPIPDSAPEAPQSSRDTRPIARLPPIRSWCPPTQATSTTFASMPSVPDLLSASSSLESNLTVLSYGDGDHADVSSWHMTPARPDQHLQLPEGTARSSYGYASTGSSFHSRHFAPYRRPASPTQARNQGMATGAENLLALQYARMAIDTRGGGPLPRTSKACNLCRKKKLKCENRGVDSICERCWINKEICTFAGESGKPGPKPSSSTEAVGAVSAETSQSTPKRQKQKQDRGSVKRSSRKPIRSSTSTDYTGTGYDGSAHHCAQSGLHEPDPPSTISALLRESDYRHPVRPGLTFETSSVFDPPESTFRFPASYLGSSRDWGGTSGHMTGSTSSSSNKSGPVDGWPSAFGADGRVMPPIFEASPRVPYRRNQ